MGDKPIRAFAPDYAIPPGQTLLESIEVLGLSQADIAARTNRPKKTINEIVNGKAAITADTALQLERVLNVPASFWLAREQQYREALARIAARKELERQVDWAQLFPTKELIRRRWIDSPQDKIDLVGNLLRFFGVASPDTWTSVWNEARLTTAFRQSQAKAADFGAMAAWLRRGEIEGRARQCEPYDVSRFRTALARIRTETNSGPDRFVQLIQQECAAAGVAVAFVQELPKARVFGAARWLQPDKALMQISLFYKSNDHFWFSFFHEAAHILLHGKRELFVDVPGTDDIRREESEANKFAGDFLIPENEFDAFVSEGDYSAESVVTFSKQLGLAPGIVVGRLQHDKVVAFQTGLNRLKLWFKWKEPDARE